MYYKTWQKNNFKEMITRLKQTWTQLHLNFNFNSPLFRWTYKLYTRQSNWHSIAFITFGIFAEFKSSLWPCQFCTETKTVFVEVSIPSKTIWRTFGYWSVIRTSFSSYHCKEICAYSLLLMSTVRITKILASDNATVDQEADVHVLVVDLKHVTYWEEKRRSLADRKSA